MKGTFKSLRKINIIGMAFEIFLFNIDIFVDF